eukprot:TRINITY_DN1799_c0_g1_i2.p1 TRINITY_DN1799_c0_g1~~TRINITY_DN1799_c0_g1_i2.p1  ORF type:complete len:333 (-),score=57.62 TRINITY_DN1799_c0_g1_i2:980-1978(-)
MSASTRTLLISALALVLIGALLTSFSLGPTPAPTESELQSLASSRLSQSPATPPTQGTSKPPTQQAASTPRCSRNVTLYGPQKTGTTFAMLMMKHLMLEFCDRSPGCRMTYCDLFATPHRFLLPDCVAMTTNLDAALFAPALNLDLQVNITRAKHTPKLQNSISTLRNPRSQAISWWSYMGLKKEFPNVNDYLRHKKYKFVKYHVSLLADWYKAQQECPTCLVIQNEFVLTNSSAVIVQISKFLGLGMPSAETLERMVKLASPDGLKDTEYQHYSRAPGNDWEGKLDADVDARFAAEIKKHYASLPELFSMYGPREAHAVDVGSLHPPKPFC